MAKKSEKMTDSMGREVYRSYVPKYDQIRDDRVQRIVSRWRKARALLETVMIDTLSDLEKIAEARGEAGMAAAEKGNMQVSSFDGLSTVAINVRYEIHLDERVIQARELMYQCARGIAAKLASDEAQVLEALIDEAFQPTRSGSLSVARVLSLMRRQVNAPAWQQAKKLLEESMETRRGKSYVSVSVRPSRQHDPESIRLDVADCWPMPDTSKEVADE